MHLMNSEAYFTQDNKVDIFFLLVKKNLKHY